MILNDKARLVGRHSRLPTKYRQSITTDNVESCGAV